MPRTTSPPATASSTQRTGGTRNGAAPHATRQAIDQSSAQATAELFDEYRGTGNQRVRTVLVERHLDLARSLARRYRYRGESLDDLVQVASVGLVKAVDGFDPTMGTSFAAFATPTITGELKRHFRDHGWGMRVPRRLQELARAVKQATEDLNHDLGRPPSRADIARHLGATEDDVAAALDASRAYQPRSIDVGIGEQGAGDDSITLGDSLGDDDPGFDRADARMTATRLIEHLHEPERSVVRLRFLHNMVQVQIAEELGMSQMRVSRLLAKSCERMRALDEAMRR